MLQAASFFEREYVLAYALIPQAGHLTFSTARRLFQVIVVMDAYTSSFLKMHRYYQVYRKVNGLRNVFAEHIQNRKILLSLLS